MPTQRISFPGSLGSKLAALIDLPKESKPKAYALFAHCFTCNKDYKAVVNIAKVLNEHSIGVFRFDFTGLGQSEGDFGDTTFTSNIQDLVAAAQYMGDAFESPRLLIGHSLGGAAVLNAATEITSVKAIVTIAAPSNSKKLTGLLKSKEDEFTEQGHAEVEISGRSFRVKKSMLDDLSSSKFTERLSEMKIPLMILHSPSDRTVHIDHAAAIFKAARHPKSFVSLDDADHLLSSERDSRFAGALIAAWADRYITGEYEE